MRDPLEPIREVYEKNKHLDIILADAAWCDGNTGYSIAHNLWIAIREAMKRCNAKDVKAE